jgi:hypothetical protein
MKSNELHAMVAEQKILNKIYVIRTEKVMLDFDLAVMYGVETKTLEEAGKKKFGEISQGLHV